MNKAQCLWNNRSFTDATIVCGKQRIPVHRCILGCASPFFENAFQSAMREAKDTSITIHDFNAETVEAFIEYLYTSGLPQGFDSTKLLLLAHRYECDELLELCASDLLDSISEETCVEYSEMLRPFENDRLLGSYWTKFAERIGSDVELGKALLRGRFGKAK